MKPWYLTRSAEAAVRGIANWTLERFGDTQAAAYRDALIARCDAVADGRAQSRSCADHIDSRLPADLRFTKSGQHLIVFVETPDRVIIVDILHSRADLPRRLQGLGEGE